MYSIFDGSDEWTPGAQGVNYDSERQDRYNVTIFYTSDLGSDGSIFMMDTIDSDETNKGTQFDPKIADILLKLIKSGRIEME